MYINNLGYLPEIGFRLSPDKTAIIQGEVTLSFADLEARANRVANGLLGLGIGRGDRVALLFPNAYQFVESLLGTMRAGAVAVPVNIRLGYDSLRHVIADSDARVIIVAPELVEMAERLAGDVPAVERLVATGSQHPRALDYEAWLDGASSERPSVQVAPDDLCLLPYTSGSTGLPKGVRLHHSGQVHNADAMRRIYLLGPDERAVIAVPLYHANGLCGALLPFLMAGGSVVILPHFDGVAVVEAIDRHHCTYTTGVPAMYKLILREREALARTDLSSIRFLACGSAPVPDELMRQLEETFPGADVIESYGLTEGGPVVAVSPRWGIKKRGSTGLLLPDVEARIVADDGVTDLGPDEVGELWVRSPGNALGYHKLPEVTAARFDADGWLRTGDLMKYDRDGYYFFLGRRDDMINCGGENVYPKEVETILIQHPNVADACVVSAPHEMKGEAPVAFVVPRDPATADADEIKQFFFANGPAYAHPRTITFVETLPLTGAGKLDRAALTKQAREAALGAAQAGA
jgi:acyl-CoA synthetase (AMP-forming)/AMP-acid ligase II